MITRYNEHTRNIRLNKDESAYAQHILNNQHQYGRITKIMEVIERAKKGNIMNIKEEYQIYYHYKHNKLIDEQRQLGEANSQNNMFDIIILHMNTP